METCGSSVAVVPRRATLVVELGDGTVVNVDDAPGADYRPDVYVGDPDANGYRTLAWIAPDMDGDREDPFDAFDQGERIEIGRDFWRFDVDDVRGAIDGAGGIGNGWRVFLVDSSGYPRRDRIEDGARWIYMAPADVPRDSVAAYVDAVWQEWRMWADGEVYGVCTVTVDPDGYPVGEVDAVWGFIGMDNAEDNARMAAEHGGL